LEDCNARVRSASVIRKTGAAHVAAAEAAPLEARPGLLRALRSRLRGLLPGLRLALGRPRTALLRGRSLGSRRRCALGSRRCPLDRRRRFRFRREQRLRHGCERQNARRHKKTALHDRTPRYCSPSLPDRVTKGCLCCIDVEPSLRSICLRCCKKGSQGDAQGGAGFRVIHAWIGAWKSLRKPVSSRDLPGPN